MNETTPPIFSPGRWGFVLFINRIDLKLRIRVLKKSLKQTEDKIGQWPDPNKDVGDLTYGNLSDYRKHSGQGS